MIIKIFSSNFYRQYCALWMRDYGLGFFCSIERAESPCRWSRQSIAMERVQQVKPVKNCCNLSYYTSHFSIRRMQSSHKSIRRTIWSIRFYLPTFKEQLKQKLFRTVFSSLFFVLLCRKNLLRYICDIDAFTLHFYILTNTKVKYFRIFVICYYWFRAIFFIETKGDS